MSDPARKTAPQRRSTWMVWVALMACTAAWLGHIAPAAGQTSGVVRGTAAGQEPGTRFSYEARANAADGTTSEILIGCIEGCTGAQQYREEVAGRINVVLSGQGGGGQLITMWADGGGGHVRVYQLSPNLIARSLNVRSTTPPNVTIKKDGNIVVVTVTADAPTNPGQHVPIQFVWDKANGEFREQR